MDKYGKRIELTSRQKSKERKLTKIRSPHSGKFLRNEKNYIKSEFYENKNENENENENNNCNINLNNSNHFKFNINKDINNHINNMIKNELEEKPEEDNVYKFADFLEYELKKYDLPKNICNDENSNEYYLSSHGGITKTLNRDNFEIPDNVYIISLEREGLLWASLELEYLFIRMCVQNMISQKFMDTIITETMKFELNILKKMIKVDKLKKYLENFYFTKYFKIYGPGEEFTDYGLTTEENKKFYTGLFKLPIKTSIVNSSTGEKIINSGEFNRLLTEVPEIINDNYIDKLLKCLKPDDYVNEMMIQHNDYYTFHYNYLQKMKNNNKISNMTNKMFSFKDLGVDIKNGRNYRKTKKVYFKDIINKLMEKNNPTEDNPLIILCNFCTKSIRDTNKYPQNILKTVYNFTTLPNSPIFNDNNYNEFYKKKMKIKKEKIVNSANLVQNNGTNDFYSLLNQFHNNYNYNYNHNYINFNYDNNNNNVRLKENDIEFLKNILEKIKLFKNTFEPIFSNSNLSINIKNENIVKFNKFITNANNNENNTIEKEYLKFKNNIENFNSEFTKYLFNMYFLTFNKSDYLNINSVLPLSIRRGYFHNNEFNQFNEFNDNFINFLTQYYTLLKEFLNNHNENKNNIDTFLNYYFKEFTINVDPTIYGNKFELYLLPLYKTIIMVLFVTKLYLNNQNINIRYKNMLTERLNEILGTGSNIRKYLNNSRLNNIYKIYIDLTISIENKIKNKIKIKNFDLNNFIFFCLFEEPNLIYELEAENIKEKRNFKKTQKILPKFIKNNNNEIDNNNNYNYNNENYSFF